VLSGLLCLLVVTVAWFVVRSRALAPAVAELGENRSPPKYDRWDVAAGAGCLALACLPLMLLMPWLSGGRPVFWGDGATHADVAQDIARYGLPHGWLDSTLGGFPFLHHYPPLPWLVVAAAIRLGLEPAGALQLVGWGATLGVPFSFYAAALAAGARPSFAFLGSACLTWVSPYNAFIGGYETFYTQGLLSQTLALPICTWFGASLVGSRKTWPLTVSAALAMGCHPQVTVATVVVLGSAVVAAGERWLWRRYAWGSAVAVCSGAALYGQGIGSLVIPFGWPPAFGWRQLGFTPDRLWWWFVDAELFDQRREPVLTALVTAAFLVLLCCLRRRDARAAAAALLGAVLLSVSGSGLVALGKVGAILLSFLQPLRLAALIPLAAAAVVVVALERATPLVTGALEARGRVWAARRAAGGIALAVLGIAVLALPSRVAFARAHVRASQGAQCPPGYDATLTRSWLAELSRGRVWYDEASRAALGRCFTRDGLALASGVPIGATDAVGSHVGILQLAFEKLDPNRAGSARRAEALGVRSLLTLGVPDAGWVERHRSGSVALFDHERPSDLVGLGCVTRGYAGTDKALRERLVLELSTPRGADRLLDPDAPVALEFERGAFREWAEPAQGCSATGARLSTHGSTPGELEARVENRHPVDAVLRVTAFPGWRVTLDGRPAATRMVAPGFISVRLPPGTHQLVARASLLPGSSSILLVALLGILAASLPAARWLRAPR